VPKFFETMLRCIKTKGLINLKSIRSTPVVDTDGSGRQGAMVDKQRHKGTFLIDDNIYEYV